MEPEIQKLDGGIRKQNSWPVLRKAMVSDYLKEGMRIVITGGPASEPIDQVRFITNQSTGELATTLAQCFSVAGHDVELFLGSGASWRPKTAVYFQTNEDLESLLSEVAERGRVDAVLHAAALSDFGVSRVRVSGEILTAAKLSSDAERIELLLVPKPKLIRRLRELFSQAYIVGWKFELEGTPAEVVQEGVEQIRRNQTNACVVNGSAFGPAFGFCTDQGLIRTLATKEALSHWLLEVVGGAVLGAEDGKR